MATINRHGYVLVTPVRNEERTIEITIKSVLSQTDMPREWVIVSDQSTDRTDAIISQYAGHIPWLRLISLKDRPPRNFASVVYVTEIGIKSLRTADYAFLGLLDADVCLPEDYYTQMLDRFAADSRLGLAGGLVVDVVNGRRTRGRQSLREVAGAVQFFRRNCFESLGGLTPLAEGGWDVITCVRARMQGFKTTTFPDLIVDHLKPRNSAEGNLLRRNWQMGVRDYVLASHPLFEIARCCSRCLEYPPVVNSLARLAGYGWATVANRNVRLSDDVASYMRREQLARILPFVRPPG